MKNRGMLLESLINKSIKKFDRDNIAIMHKINVPIKFGSINKTGNILEAKNAYIASKSTTDYYGIYNGLFLAFEAKSTKGDILPISNIKKHQINYLHRIDEHRGLAFYIIHFSDYDEFYILLNKDIDYKNIKSLKRDWVKENGYSLSLEYPGTLNITEVIDQIA